MIIKHDDDDTKMQGRDILNSHGLGGKQKNNNNPKTSACQGSVNVSAVAMTCTRHACHMTHAPSHSTLWPTQRFYPKQDLNPDGGAAETAKWQPLGACTTPGCFLSIKNKDRPWRGDSALTVKMAASRREGRVEQTTVLARSLHCFLRRVCIAPLGIVVEGKGKIWKSTTCCPSHPVIPGTHCWLTHDKPCTRNKHISIF